MRKHNKEWFWLKGKEMPFTCFGKQTGVWGMYCSQVRHNWYGIKGIYGLRITKRCGYNHR